MPELSDVSLEMTSTHVGVLEIRRPPNNYFDTELIRSLVVGAQRLERDSQCRAIVICSQGKHFCAGAQFSKGEPSQESIYSVALELFAIELPMVVAVQGSAIGGGMGLALVGDFRIGGPRTNFRPNFARLGINHGFGMTVTLPSVVGDHRALQILEMAHPIDAAHALTLGLLDAVVPEDELRNKALEYASDLASCAPKAVRAIRNLMRHGRLEELRKAIQAEGANQLTLLQSNDFREGTSAASERRDPLFTNT